MITLQLTEAEAARIIYAIAAEATEHNLKVWDEKIAGGFSATSGRSQMIHEAARDECMGIIRKIEAQS